MQRELSWAQGKTLDESYFLLSESATQAYYGRLAKARKLTRAAVASARRDGHKDLAAQMQTWDAMVDAELGNLARGRQTTRAALALSNDDGTRWCAATALAVSGDSAYALRLLEALSKGNSLQIHAQSYWLVGNPCAG